MVDGIKSIFYELGVVLFIWTIVLYVLSLIFKRNDIADIGWGLSFILVSLFFWFKGFRSENSSLIYVLILVWGLRLSIYLLIRNRKKTEDFRYKKWRQEWGENFYWRSYLQVFLLQAVIMLFIASPLFASILDPRSDLWQWPQIIGVGLFGLGFFWQSIADYQLLQFKKEPENKGRIIQNGLWKYSRHPNYFGEILIWLGISFTLIMTNYWWLSAISPVFITYLLLNVSGVPMLEKKYDGNEEFEAYKQNTPAVFPWTKSG